MSEAFGDQKSFFMVAEPTLDSLQLEKIDEYADSIEIERLLGMKVIANRADFTGELGFPFSFPYRSNML